MRRRSVRLSGTFVVTGLCVAYLVWKIDLRRTAHILADANLYDLVLAFAINALSVWPMALRWRWLLKARGIEERQPWLVRAYYTAYTAGQVLPTSIGGDAMRIFETSRRHPGNGGPVAGTVLLERALGGAATLTLAAVGFVLAIGHYDVGPYLWVEGAFVLATIALGVALFSRRAARQLARTEPLLRRMRVDKPIRNAYIAIHAYRSNVRLLFAVFALTLAVQSVRVLSIWLAGRAVGVDLPPRPYYVMGPLLFLVMLVPFTINGLAVRETFFVSFLGQLGVEPSKAFATGFVFFLVTVALSLPGAAILAWEAIRRSGRSTQPRAGHG
jgi:uncharacterized protein (TIRG00374 family)